MRKINIANIICFIIIVISGLLTPTDMTRGYWFMMLFGISIANFVLFIIASVKRYKGIKNELKEDGLYKVVAILNTVVLIVLAIVISYIPYKLEGWDGLIIAFVVVILIGLFIANSITFVISQKLCTKLYLNMESIDENVKKCKRKQNIIINVILIIIAVFFMLLFLLNVV